MSVNFSSNMFSSLNKKEHAQQFETENKKRYDEVYAHELAHKSAAGSLGGSIVIERDANGMVTGGHVPISIPGLNKAKPQETLKQAQQVIDSAMAPSDPSDQDYKVAAQARSVIAMAQQEITSQKEGKTLDIQA